MWLLMFLCSSLQKDKNGSGFSWLGGQGEKSNREVFVMFSLSSIDDDACVVV